MITGLLVPVMLKSGTFPVPGVIGITPDTVQVAKRGTYKDTGAAQVLAFSLYGVEDLGGSMEAGDFHESWGLEEFNDSKQV